MEERKIIRQQNIIIFCASKSDEKCQAIISFFEKTHHKCYHWQELFKNAKDQDKRLILITLIKKIPTFDFAIILSDATDILERDINLNQKINTEDILEQKFEYKKGKIVRRVIRESVMRDNVLYECGLCVTALGADRVILLKEKSVRIPEDLHNGLIMGVKTFEYSNVPAEFYKKLKNVNVYIERTAPKVSPIVIGAAITTADGYLSNFILRFWENVNNKFIDLETNSELKPDVSKIQMNIYIPSEIISSNPNSKDMNYNDLKEKMINYYTENNYKKGKIIARNSFRDVEFRYKIAGNEFIILDYPSTLTASYDTVKDILDLNANESHDSDAEKRFLMKERDSFIFTLKELMTEKSLKSKLNTFAHYQKKKTEIPKILTLMKQVEIIEDIPDLN